MWGVYYSIGYCCVLYVIRVRVRGGTSRRPLLCYVMYMGVYSIVYRYSFVLYVFSRDCYLCRLLLCEMLYSIEVVFICVCVILYRCVYSYMYTYRDGEICVYGFNEVSGAIGRGYLLI